MQLEYNILWIDNDIQDYINIGEVKNLNEFLCDLGFEPNIVTVDDEEIIEEFIFKFKYDLIISDFNLNETTGDVIIEKIRNKGLSTEIFFYTAKGNYRTDPEVKDRLAFIDRITFHIGRETFLSKVEELIKLTLDKILELNATRGLITAATSALDVELEEIYHLLLEDLQKNQTLDAKIKGIFAKDFKEIEKFLLKKSEKQLACYSTDFKLYFSQSDAFRKYKILKELIKLDTPDGFDLEIFKLYQSEVIDIRNQFAHAKAEEKQGQVVLKGSYGSEDFQFDTKSCILIRQNLIKHKKNVGILRSKFNL